MFFKYLLLFCGLLFVRSVQADNTKTWTATDTTLQVTYLTLHAMDWAQTLHIARNPQRYYETNHSLGQHPSEGRVNSYFALTGIANTALTVALPKPWRTGWQVGIIVHDYTYVQHNHRIGIGISLRF